MISRFRASHRARQRSRARSSSAGVPCLGYVYGTQGALRRMRTRDCGAIVQVGSALDPAAKRLLRGQARRRGLHRLAARRADPRQQRQPVPPMCAPEVVAEKLLWAADHAPRKLLLGTPTCRAVWEQKGIPGLLERFPGRYGWCSQFVDHPNEQESDIPFHPTPDEPGAPGPYTDREQDPDAATTGDRRDAHRPPGRIG